jgi:hypothetical protein
MAMKLFSSSSWQRRVASFVALMLLVVAPASAERIKDLAQVGGVRGNALVGYGLVVGLDGSGDRTSQAPFTVQSLKNLLGELGVNVPPNVNPQLKNVAAVAIHAELPPFAKPGQPIDITVSSIGNAVAARRFAADGPAARCRWPGLCHRPGQPDRRRLWCAGQGWFRVSVNVPSVGRIPNGATVERALPDPLANGGDITLNLHNNDFTTVSRMVAALNNAFGEGAARAVDGVTVAVTAPTDPGARIGLLAHREPGTDPGQRSGQGGGQFAYRHRGHRPTGARGTCRDLAWFADRDDPGNTNVSQPNAVRRPYRGQPAVDHHRHQRRQPHVQVQRRHHPGRDRARGERRGRRRAISSRSWKP